MNITIYGFTKSIVLKTSHTICLFIGGGGDINKRTLIVSSMFFIPNFYFVKFWMSYKRKIE